MNQMMKQLGAGSNYRILFAAVVFFSLLVVLLAPDGRLSYGPVESTTMPGPASP
jgi:hypothetical protein